MPLKDLDCVLVQDEILNSSQGDKAKIDSYLNEMTGRLTMQFREENTLLRKTLDLSYYQLKKVLLILEEDAGNLEHKKAKTAEAVRLLANTIHRLKYQKNNIRSLDKK